MGDVISPTPSVEMPFAWKTWRVTPSVLTGTTDVTVATLPAGTTINGVSMTVVAAEVGATSTAADLEIGATGAGDTELCDGGADFGGALGAQAQTYTTANLTTINAVSLGGSDLVVNLEVTYVGTATTAPTYLVHLLCGRDDY